MCGNNVVYSVYQLGIVAYCTWWRLEKRGGCFEREAAAPPPALTAAIVTADKEIVTLNPVGNTPAASDHMHSIHTSYCFNY